MCCFAVLKYHIPYHVSTIFNKRPNYHQLHFLFYPQMIVLPISWDSERKITSKRAFSLTHFLFFPVRNCCSIGLKSDSWQVGLEPTSLHLCGTTQALPACRKRHSRSCVEEQWDAQWGLRSESTGLFILKTNKFPVIKLVLISLTPFLAMCRVLKPPPLFSLTSPSSHASLLWNCTHLKSRAPVPCPFMGGWCRKLFSWCKAPISLGDVIHAAWFHASSFGASGHAQKKKSLHQRA